MENDQPEVETSEEEAKDSIVVEAKERYEIAKVAYSQTKTQAVEDTKFYLADSDNGWQWPQNIALQRSTIERRPCLTINVTAQHVNQIVNAIRENPPTGKVTPVDDFADKKTAEILGDVIRNIQSSSNAEDIHNIATEHAIAGGEGYWRIVTDYEDSSSFNQSIQIKPILDPGMVYLDPFYKELDKSDREWGFVFEDITKDECKRLWPDIDVTSWTEDKVRGWVKEDTVRVADYYCVEFIDDILYQLPDGTAEYGSQIPPEVLAQLKQMVEGGELKTRPCKRKQWKIHKLVGNSDDPVSSVDWVGSILPVIEVVGKEMMVNGEVVKKGLVRDLKDPARMVNYAYSATVESIALQNKIPYMAPADAVEGYEQIWEKANLENRSYLPYNHVDDSGNPIPKPERQMPAVLPSAQIQLLQLSVEQMRAASGQQQANFGQKSEASSGIGIQRLKMQGEIATYHFMDALNRALKYEIRVILELICSGKILDTKRVVRLMGIDGEQKHATLDPNHSQAYTEIGVDDVTKIFNPTIGSYDVAIDTGPSYMTKRIEGAAQLTQIAQQNPQMMQVAGDIVMKSLDVPYADKIAERMAKMLPPQLQDEKPGDIPPQVKQAMDMASQHIQQQDQVIGQMQQELQKYKEEDEHKDLELQIKAYQAETDRMAKMAVAATPEQIQAVVMQTLQQMLAQPPIYETATSEAQEQPQMQLMPQDIPQPMPQDQGMPQGGMTPQPPVS
ncbi:MAG: portal protein [Elusimicrobia bacterium]|nr:portal protein [Elusimicrobiota bacterium]